MVSKARPGATKASKAGDAANGEDATALSVAEIARRSGVSARNIRAYQTAGLLPPPAIQGRQALYSSSHLARLELIRELRAMGFGLEAIGDMLTEVPGSTASPYALIAQMFSRGFFQVEAPRRMTVAQLSAHWQVTATTEQAERVVRNGLYQAVEPMKPGQPLNPDTEFILLSPTLWALGKQMADLQIPLSTVLDLQDKLMEHCRGLAQAYVDQFVAAMVREVIQAREQPTPGQQPPAHETVLSATLLRTIHGLIKRLRPIAIGSVSAAFPVVLQQEFERDVVNRIQALVKQFDDGTPPLA